MEQAAAFATGNTLATFKVGLAASVGAGISMKVNESERVSPTILQFRLTEVSIWV